METVSQFFTVDHRDCDTGWADFEEAASKGDAAAAKAAWASFRGRLERHFKMEEELLFPAIENATGMHGGGPTVVMRMEHEQMRALVSQMDHKAEAGNLQAVLDHGDSLLMIIQQHNAKEEGILYPMADRALDEDEWGELRQKLERVA